MFDLITRMSSLGSIWVRQAIVLLAAVALLAGCARGKAMHRETAPAKDPRSYVQGGIVRGDCAQKKIALVFTGGAYGEGSEHILDVLARRNIKAGFFVTGDFLRQEAHHPFLRRMAKESHYLGPHSDSHPLYCPWEDRNKTLVTKEFFKEDLQKNIDDLKVFGAMQDAGPIYFIPPYEWYNEDQSEWSKEMGVVLFNFTSGSGSNRDWIPENHPKFASSQAILEGVLEYEQKDPDGLNGFLLLLHLGAQREDKMFLLLEPLLEELTKRGYEFIRMDKMLSNPLKR